MNAIRKLALLVSAGAAIFLLAGCATTASLGECALETYNPTISSALDSFESAALAIKLSNRVLLRSPLSEQDTWPSSLFGVPSGSAIATGAISILGTLSGVSGAAIEIDPQTGFPRPQSALYIFLKDRDAMLDREVSREDVAYFNKNTGKFYCTLGRRKKAETFDENVYRNVLMAYGVVTNNREEMLKVELDIQQTELGFRQCDAWARKSKQGDVKETYCKDPVLKDETLKARLVKGKIEDIESKKKAYGPLANNVYNASVAGADFTLAASSKIVCAISVVTRAVQNINNEIKGWKGVVNAALLTSRIKNAITAFGMYRDNLGLQITAYTTMYDQIRGLGYDIKDDDPRTKEALTRIEAAEPLLHCLLPKFDDLIAGREVEFTEEDQRGLALLAELYPPEGDSPGKVRFASFTH